MSRNQRRGDARKAAVLASGPFGLHCTFSYAGIFILGVAVNNDTPRAISPESRGCTEFTYFIVSTAQFRFNAPPLPATPRQR